MFKKGLTLAIPSCILVVSIRNKRVIDTGSYQGVTGFYAAAKMRREPWPAKFHGNLLNKQDRIYTWTPYQYGVDYASKECIK
jgi:hypothetical protein